MKAKIIMVVDGEEYPYGTTYPFETNEDKDRVNEIAKDIRNQRNIDVYVEPI